MTKDVFQQIKLIRSFKNEKRLKKKPSILLMIVLVGFPQISESIFTPVLPQLSRALRVSAQTVQLTMSTYFIAFAVGVLFWG